MEELPMANPLKTTCLPCTKNKTVIRPCPVSADVLDDFLQFAVNVNKSKGTTKCVEHFWKVTDPDKFVRFLYGFISIYGIYISRYSTVQNNDVSLERPNNVNVVELFLKIAFFDLLCRITNKTCFSWAKWNIWYLNNYRTRLTFAIMVSSLKPNYVVFVQR